MRLIGWAMIAVLLAWAGAGFSGTERFERLDYDALGRLIRHLDSSATITEYAYDGVGNILEVRRSVNVGPPVVSSVVPARVRRLG